MSSLFFYYTSYIWQCSLLRIICANLLINQNKDVMLAIILEAMASVKGAAAGWDASKT